VVATRDHPTARAIPTSLRWRKEGAAVAQDGAGGARRPGAVRAVL